MALIQYHVKISDNVLDPPWSLEWGSTGLQARKQPSAEWVPEWGSIRVGVLFVLSPHQVEWVPTPLMVLDFALLYIKV